MIIFLNGTSSAGKSTLARALQASHPTPLLHLGIDTFLDMMPKKFLWFAQHADQGFKIITGEKDGRPTASITTGPSGKKLCTTIPHVLNLFAEHGHDLIVDEVILRAESLKRYATALQQHTVYFIKVKADEDITTQREQNRGDRTPGMAATQAELIHTHGFKYDLTIDTSTLSPEENATTILNYIAQHPSPQAFAAITTHNK